jgi:hypothetical protein
VSFADVNQQKLNLVLILLIKPFQFASLATEGRSGVTAENEHHRLFAAKAAECHRVFSSRVGQSEIGSGIADSQRVRFSLTTSRRRVYFSRPTLGKHGYTEGYADHRSAGSPEHAVFLRLQGSWRREYATALFPSL